MDTREDTEKIHRCLADLAPLRTDIAEMKSLLRRSPQPMCDYRKNVSSAATLEEMVIPGQNVFYPQVNTTLLPQIQLNTHTQFDAQNRGSSSMPIFMVTNRTSVQQNSGRQGGLATNGTVTGAQIPILSSQGCYSFGSGPNLYQQIRFGSAEYFSPIPVYQHPVLASTLNSGVPGKLSNGGFYSNNGLKTNTGSYNDRSDASRFGQAQQGSGGYSGYGAGGSSAGATRYGYGGPYGNPNAAGLGYQGGSPGTNRGPWGGQVLSGYDTVSYVGNTGYGAWNNPATGGASGYGAEYGSGSYEIKSQLDNPKTPQLRGRSEQAKIASTDKRSENCWHCNELWTPGHNLKGKGKEVVPANLKHGEDEALDHEQDPEEAVHGDEPINTVQPNANSKGSNGEKAENMGSVDPQKDSRFLPDETKTGTNIDNSQNYASGNQVTPRVVLKQNRCGQEEAAARGKSAWEVDKMLEVYILDYPVKRNLQNTAKVFRARGNVSSDPVAIDIPREVLFEWWLAFWDIGKDGGIFHKILKDGEKWENPKDPHEVLVKYESRLEDGTVVLKSDRVGFTVNDGYFGHAFVKVAETMKKTGKVLLKIKLEYGFGEKSSPVAGGEGVIPPKTILLVDLELVPWETVTDKGNVINSESNSEVNPTGPPGFITALGSPTKEFKPEEKEQLRQVSVDVAHGVSRTFRFSLWVKVQGEQAIALVDSGSIQSLLDYDFAIKIGCSLYPVSSRKEAVAGGGLLCSDAVVQQLRYVVQGMAFNTTLKLWKLGNYDMVPGADWLYEHSPIELNLKAKLLTIDKEGQRAHFSDFTQPKVNYLLKAEQFQKLAPKNDPAKPIDSSIETLLKEYADAFAEVSGLPSKRDYDHVIHRKPRVVPSMDAVVTVFCVRMEPNLSLSWQRKRQSSASSSGFSVGGRLVLTNAHSVEPYTQVKLKRRGSDTKYLATALANGTECANLTDNDEEFWEGVAPVEFGSLPALLDAATVVGYLIGGDTISVTSGVVSRIEILSYVHGFTELPGLQIDATINSGNSGGPAYKGKGKCVGIAFQFFKHEDEENIGHVIPEWITDVKARYEQDDKVAKIISDLQTYVGGHSGLIKTEANTILARRMIPRKGLAVTQWLAQWLNVPAEDAAWEDASFIRSTFLISRLEDKSWLKKGELSGAVKSLVQILIANWKTKLYC